MAKKDSKLKKLHNQYQGEILWVPKYLFFKTFRKNDTPTKYLCSGHAGLLQKWYVNQLQNEVR